MAKAKRWALSVPIDGFALPEHADLAQEAERLGYTDAWSYEADGLDCFASLAPVALATGMRLGTAIANVFTRGPATLAMSAATVADLAPGRSILGIGAARSRSWSRGTAATSRCRPRACARWQVVRAVLTGERVVFRGKALTVDGFRLVRPPAAPVPIYVAALRPGMLRVAGEVGDGVILNWLSASDVPGVVRVVREAAAAAGRDPASIEITARLLVNVNPEPAGQRGVRRHVTAYLNVPVYRAFQEWLGRGPVLTPMWQAWEQGDRKAALAAVPEQVMADIILRGSMAEIRAHVRRYLEAGIDTAFLQVSTLETDPARRRQVLGDAVRALAPSAG